MKAGTTNIRVWEWIFCPAWKTAFQTRSFVDKSQEVGWNELADYYGDRKGRKKAICRFVMSFAWSQDVPVWEKAFTACSVKG